MRLSAAELEAIMERDALAYAYANVTPAHKDVRALLAHVDALQREIDAFKADALRYRWVRNSGDSDLMVADLRAASHWEEAVTINGTKLDAAIDASQLRLLSKAASDE